MKNTYQTGERGFIKWILLIIVALLVISYFGINLRELISSPTTQDNFAYTATTTVTFWNKYLKEPTTYIWKEIFINLIWEPALDNLKNAKADSQGSHPNGNGMVPAPAPVQ
mgnify:CR=1 FL=1